MTRFPQQLFLSANACNGIFEVPAIIVNNTMKWSINWSLELRYVLVCSKPRYVLVCSKPQSKTVMDWEATSERLLTTPPSLPLPPHFPHHSTLHADSPMLLDKTVQVWPKKKTCKQTMYVSSPLGTGFHTHQKCPLTEMFFPVASLFNGLQAMFSSCVFPLRHIQRRTRNIPDIIGV